MHSNNLYLAQCIVRSYIKPSVQCIGRLEKEVYVKDLNQFLKEMRIKNGLKQWDVARRLGYESPQFISNWERGISEPPLHKWKEVAQIYGIPKNEITKRLIANYKEKLQKYI